MAKKKTYCEWCGGETNNKPTLISKITIMEDIEEKIDELGREEVFNDYYHSFPIETDNETRAKIYAYLDLMSDVKERIICSYCLDVDDEMNDKYYSMKNIEIFPFDEE